MPEFPTLFLVDRPVVINAQAVFPRNGRRLNGVAMWVRSNGLRLEPYVLGRQIAWIRRCDGGFWALVLIVAHSANGQSTLPMQLWVEPENICTDTAGLEHFLDAKTLPPPRPLA